MRSFGAREKQSLVGATMALGIAAKIFLASALMCWFHDASAQDIRIAVAGSMTGSLAEAGDRKSVV